jgi:hypothetical protein
MRSSLLAKGGQHLAAGALSERLPAFEVPALGRPDDEDLACAEPTMALDRLSVEKAVELAVRGIEVQPGLGDESRAVEDGERAAVLERPGGSTRRRGRSSGVSAGLRGVTKREKGPTDAAPGSGPWLCRTPLAAAAQPTTATADLCQGGRRGRKADWSASRSSRHAARPEANAPRHVADEAVPEEHV